MPTSKRYWFPAKRYGWGWGLPATWEGWAVFLAFIGLMALAAVIFPPDKELRRYLACVALLSVMVIAVAWWKGEPPRWRWGGN